MKKAIAILLTALLLLTVFVSCEGDVEDLFGDNITITFNGNGSTSGQMAALKVARGKEVRLTANAYEKTDSEFTGWNTKADGSGYKYKDEEFVYFEEDTTLYAQWSSGVTITFNANYGETPETTTQEVEKDVETALAANSFTSPEADKIFAGWTTGSDGSGTYYGDKETVTLTENLVLYAQWAVDLYATKQTAWNADNDTLYSLSSSTEITSRITVTGSVTLILPKDKTLTANMGINVSTDNALTIEGKGNLNATGGDCQAGIGGGYEGAGGTVTINGGTVTAEGGIGGAGIGGGTGGAGGIITINGGTVYATGASYGAGIGGGDNGSTGGTVTINGGTVTAEGGMGGAGIGGGWSGAGETVTITGGTVIANGGNLAAGIGGGTGGAGGKVTINGGTVTATGGSANEYYGPGAGIGAGGEGPSHGKLTIGYAEIQANSLVIKSGWSLYYGNSENPTVHVDGLHNANDISDYVGRYMNVTQP